MEKRVLNGIMKISSNSTELERMDGYINDVMIGTVAVSKDENTGMYILGKIEFRKTDLMSRNDFIRLLNIEIDKENRKLKKNVIKELASTMGDVVSPILDHSKPKIDASKQL